MHNVGACLEAVFYHSTTCFHKLRPSGRSRSNAMAVASESSLSVRLDSAFEPGRLLDGALDSAEIHGLEDARVVFLGKALG